MWSTTAALAAVASNALRGYIRTGNEEQLCCVGEVRAGGKVYAPLDETWFIPSEGKYGAAGGQAYATLIRWLPGMFARSLRFWYRGRT
jgi:hypothetical protein